MNKLLSILLICSIGFTQELTVDGNLNVTGNIQNQTIDSLLQVIQSLENNINTSNVLFMSASGNHGLTSYERVFVLLKDKVKLDC